MLEKYSTIAFWYEQSFRTNMTWETCAHYLILGPTGPRCKSYWAMLRTWYNGKSKKVRLPASVGKGIPMTEQEYRAKWAQCVKEQEQEAIWKALSK